MCFSQYAQYVPRPVKEYTPPVRPEGAPPTNAELDDNLFGPKPMPPEWQQPATVAQNGHDQTHKHNGSRAAPAAAINVVGSQQAGTTVASVTTQTVEAVVVELSNGTKLLICPL